MILVLRELQHFTDEPVFIGPSSGEPVDQTGNQVFDHIHNGGDSE